MDIKPRSLATCIILSIITCGIYGIYWEICLFNEFKAVYGKDELPNGGMVVLLTIVTCGIYNFYYMYKAGKTIDDYEGAGSNAVLFIVLTLIGLGIVNMCIMQDKVNHMVGTPQM